MTTGPAAHRRESATRRSRGRRRSSTSISTRHRSRSARSPNPTSRTSATAPPRCSAMSRPPTLCRRRSTARRSAASNSCWRRRGHRQLLPDAGHRGRGRTHPGSERRRLAGRPSGRHARLPVLPGAFGGDPQRRRTRDAPRRLDLHGDRVGSSRIRRHRARPHAGFYAPNAMVEELNRSPMLDDRGHRTLLVRARLRPRATLSPGRDGSRGGGRATHPRPHRGLGPGWGVRGPAPHRRAALRPWTSSVGPRHGC